MEDTSKGAGPLNRTITRRQAIKAGGIAVLGLAFSKPIIDTIRPRTAFAANYVVVSGACTPGYWKQPHHFGDWPISQSTQLGGIFDFGPVTDGGVQDLAGDTFLAALGYGGGPGVLGGAKIMLRAAAAAYLNALAFSFPLSPSQVVSQVDAALASNDRQTMIDLGQDLDDKNNDGECRFLRANE